MEIKTQTATYTYDTVSQAINGLFDRGYTIDFALYAEGNCLVCHKTAISLSPEEFSIDEVYRFEGNSDPGDAMIVFAVSSEKYQAKGIVVNAFGMYTDSSNSKLVKHLHHHL